MGDESKTKAKGCVVGIGERTDAILYFIYPALLTILPDILDFNKHLILILFIENNLVYKRCRCSSL